MNKHDPKRFFPPDICGEMAFALPKEKVVLEDGKKWVEHIVKEGARFHVIRWDSNGSHCSEKNCIINRR